MISAAENERLTRVGRGTPAGELLRRYWLPIAGVDELRDRSTLPVKLLGEDLELERTRDGTYALGAYPVEALGGVLFAYLGPAPAPLVPRLDGFVHPGTIRMLGRTHVPCNWLQIMENSLDPVHTEWLHGHLQEFVEEQRTGHRPRYAISRHHVDIAFDEFEYGIYKRRLMEGQSKDADDWRVGHPVMFPCTLSVGSAGGFWTSYMFQIRVPMDDANTMHFWYTSYVPPDGHPVPQHLLDEVPTYQVPFRGADGDFDLTLLDAQDIMAWVTQGPIAQRHREKLGWTDRGVIMLRKMLAREIDKVAAGQDPIGVLRDPAHNTRIDLPVERGKDMFSDGFASIFQRLQTRYYPYADDLLALFRDANPARLPRELEPA